MTKALIIMTGLILIAAVLMGTLWYLQTMTPDAVYSRQKAAETRAETALEQAKAEAKIKEIEALANIEKLKNQRQTQAIEYKKQMAILNTPWIITVRQVKTAWLEALPVIIPACVFVFGLVVFYGVTRWRPVEYRTGETATTIPMHKACQFVAAGLDIERLRATEGRAVYEAIEQGTERRLTGFVQGVRALKGVMSHHAQALPEQAAPAIQAVPVTLPAFPAVLAALEPGDQMYLGTDTETGDDITGTFDDLYSSFFAGETGSGKSSWLRGIIAQSLLTCPGVRYYLLDPHASRPDSLTASLPSSEAFTHIDAANPTPGIYAFNQGIQGRLDAPADTVFPPLVFVCDELSYCSKQKYAPALQTLFDRIATEGRKVSVYLLVSSQDTRLKKGLDFRDCLVSSYVFKLKTKQASYLLQDKDETQKHKSVKEKGKALLSLTTGESRLVKVPYCAPADLLCLQQQTVAINSTPEPTTQQTVDTTVQTVAEDATTLATDRCKGGDLSQSAAHYMQQHNLSLSKFATLTGVNKGTLSTFLRTGKLSEEKRTTLATYLATQAQHHNNVIDLASRREEGAES